MSSRFDIDFKKYFDENPEVVERMAEKLLKIHEAMKPREEFLENGGTIFPEGNPRTYNELNQFEQEEVAGYLHRLTLPTTGVFEGDTPEERFGIEWLDEISLSMSK